MKAERRAKGGAYVKIQDALQVIGIAEKLAGWRDHRAYRVGTMDTADKAAADICAVLLELWRKTNVVLRVDSDFAAALLNSDTDVQLDPGWMDRLPYESVACVFPQPLSLFDGDEMCHYEGFIVTGIRSKPLNDRPAQGKYGSAWTTYGPMHDKADGLRFLWLFRDDEHQPRAQTVTLLLRGEIGGSHENAPTITTVIDNVRRSAREQGAGWGEELDTLVPLSIQLLLYLVASKPDLDWVPEEQMSRPPQHSAVKVANVGWRVGTALRTWRGAAKKAPGGRMRIGGWRLPPHIRKAHWHRVRLAMRDEAGTIVGSRTGEQGVDWYYEMLWYPPTPVNVSDDAAAYPVVRDLATESSS